MNRILIISYHVNRVTRNKDTGKEIDVEKLGRKPLFIFGNPEEVKAKVQKRAAKLYNSDNIEIELEIVEVDEKIPYKKALEHWKNIYKNFTVMENKSQKIIQNLVAETARKGINQKEFAKLMGVTPHTIHKYFSYRTSPSIEFILEAAEKLGVKQKDLLI